MNRRVVAGAAVLALATAGGVGLAIASGGSGLDDGKDLLPEARITLQEAEQAAQSAAPGSLNETDLEYYEGRLVFNVDVGSRDVKVDAATGKVLSAPVDE